MPWIPICPLCGSRLDIAKLRYGMPFLCTCCKKALYIRGFYFWFPVLTGFLVTGLFGYLLGFRFPRLLVFPVLFGFPVGVLFWLILTSSFNPKIEEHYPDYFDLKRRF
jgi:hypothetical protein